MSGPVRTGLDVLGHAVVHGPDTSSQANYSALRALGLLSGKALGLVTNASGHSSAGMSTEEVLRAISGASVKALFAPEHGITGTLPAGQKIPNSVSASGIPVHSLYGETRRPTPSMLEGIEVFVYDLQDAGMRFYTYLSTLGLCMEACAEAGIPFLVLDRPNPLGGLMVEGPMIKPGYVSFVGMYPVPVRYGLTPLEAASYIDQACSLGADLHGVAMDGFQRWMWYGDTGLDWIPPSPGLPTLGSVSMYGATCLLEGTNVSCGRGTDSPFEIIGAPWIRGQSLCQRINAEICSVSAEAARFVPVGWDYAGEVCEGAVLRIRNRSSYKPVEVGLRLVSIIMSDYPRAFEWRPPSSEGRQHFDLLIGSDAPRAMLDEGMSVERITSSWQDDIIRFCEDRMPHLLY